jgi:hypothetical protein
MGWNVKSNAASWHFADGSRVHRVIPVAVKNGDFAGIDRPWLISRYGVVHERYLTMKRNNSKTAAQRSSKRLVLNRETLRKLEASEMEHVAGASYIFTCGCTTTTTNQQNNGDL